MVNEKYIALIEKLIEMSKNNKLSWKYLDSAEDLCDNMNWRIAPTDITDMFEALGDLTHIDYYDSENSFVYLRDSTYLVLFMKINSTTPLLYVIPHTYRGIVTLKPAKYGEYITRLFNIVKSSFPHADDFIDKFLSED